MRIECPTCRAPIAEEAVDRAHHLARCAACRAVLDCSAALATGSAQRRRRPVPMPEAFTVVEGAGGAGAEAGYRQAAPRGGPPVTIVRRWYNKMAWIMVVFLVFWFSVLSTAFFGRADTPLAFRLFPLIHVAAGLFVAYYTLCLFLNRTTIVVTDDEISVDHAPLPWPGRRRVPAGDVAQLFTRERVTKGKNGETRTYELTAMMKNGTEQIIVKSLPEPAQSLFLEQRIEERLGIVDVDVDGEYRG